jgi:hypothetical protein
MKKIFTFPINCENGAMPLKLPFPAHASSRQSILRNVLKVGDVLSQVVIGGVGICYRRRGIIFKLFLDIPEGHLERKYPSIDVKKAFLPVFEAGGNIVYMMRKTIPLGEGPPVS